MTMHSTMNTAAAVCAAAATVTAGAQEVTVQNDSFEGAGTIVGDFVPGEQAGTRLTAPCDGAIVAVQVLWLAGSAGQPASLEQAIHIRDGATFPTPGVELETLEGPVMTPGFINEFRYLDDTMNFPLSVPVSAGQQFYVILEFANATDVGGGGPSVVRDVDGCQSGDNVLFAIPGGWFNFCLLLQGDLVIRAVVDCSATSSCDWDCGDQDQVVGIVDFLTLLAQWGSVGTSCDFDDNGVGINDFLDLLAHWGPCP